MERSRNKLRAVDEYAYQDTLFLVFKLQATSKAMMAVIGDGDIVHDDKYDLDEGDAIVLAQMMVELSHELHEAMELMNVSLKTKIEVQP